MLRVIHISTVASVLCWPLANAMSAYGAADDLRQIGQLEAQLFEARLEQREVEALLERLSDAEKRPIAAGELVQGAQGFQERIVAYARRTSSSEARQACADIVAALDGTYRTTELGKQLGALYHKHTQSLAIARWKDFRENPLDVRAVAMLVHGDPQVIYNALGDKDYGRERIRYLLLRLRELAEDDFVRRHITETSAAKIYLAIPDVFPHHLPQNGVGIHRIVGHNALNRVEVPRPEITQQRSGSTPPRPSGIRFQRRRTYLFKCPVHYRPGQYYYAYLVFQRWNYYVDASTKEPVVRLNERPLRSLSSPLPGLAKLPELAMSKAHTSSFANNGGAAPLWIKPYVPLVLRDKVVYRPGHSNEAAPRLMAAGPLPAAIAPAAGIGHSPVPPAEAPSIVVLPPGLAKGEREEVRIAGELICDRMAQELDRLGQFQIVDRTQLDNILRERKIDPKLTSPLVSYDGMVRVEVDTARPQPEVRVGVLDLSNGNLIKEEPFAWPGREQDVARMVALCRSAIATLDGPQQKRLRIRLVGFAEQAVEDRIAPLKRKLQTVMRLSLRRSPRIVLVDHLAARSSQEESLLLLMGVSALPGGRQFAPQADATIAFRVQEHPARDTPFEQTRLTVVFDYASEMA